LERDDLSAVAAAAAAASKVQEMYDSVLLLQLLRRRFGKGRLSAGVSGGSARVTRVRVRGRA